MSRPPAHLILANALARTALRIPILERMLLAGTRQPTLRRHLRLGAIAHGFARVLQRHELRIAELDGYRLYVNVGEPLGVEPYFFKEPGTVWLTRSLLRRGDVCVDVGANAGTYTFLCASAVGPTGKVFAFEPNPTFAGMLRRSRDLNAFGNIVEVEQRAMSSSTEDRQRFFLSTNPMNTGTSSLSTDALFLSEENTIAIDTISFDAFAEARKLEHFRFVKIDVERAEDKVIAGASSTLRSLRIDYIILEMLAGGAAQDLPLRAGYRCFLIVHDERRLIPLADVPINHFGDYLFVSPAMPVP